MWCIYPVEYYTAIRIKDFMTFIGKWMELENVILNKVTQSLKNTHGGWRDGSVVKNIDCSSTGPEFNSQQPHGGSQPSVIESDVLFWCV